MTRSFPRKDAPRCGCGRIVKLCGCGAAPALDAAVEARKKEIAALEMRIARLKDSVASHQRAEQLAFDRYVTASAKAAGLLP